MQVIQADFIHDCNKTDDNIYATCNITAMLSKFLQGYNVAILAYDQTGSGKTYALEGDSSTKGIIELAIAAIYKNRPCESAVIRCSYIQLYN